MKYSVEELKHCEGLSCIFNNALSLNGPVVAVDAVIKNIYRLQVNFYVNVTIVSDRQEGKFLGRVLEIPMYDQCRDKRLLRLLINA